MGVYPNLQARRACKFGLRLINKAGKFDSHLASNSLAPLALVSSSQALGKFFNSYYNNIYKRLDGLS